MQTSHISDVKMASSSRLNDVYRGKLIARANSLAANKITFYVERDLQMRAENTQVPCSGAICLHITDNWLIWVAPTRSKNW